MPSDRSSTRRRLVALAAVTALAAGTAAVLAPAATADVSGWPATDGGIAVINDGITLVDSTGAGGKYVYGGSDAETPAWSPDGSRVAFEEAGFLRTVSVTGGTPTTVYDGVENGRSPSHPTYWNAGSGIVFSATKKLYSVPSDGGTAGALFATGGGCDTLPSAAAVGRLVAFQRGGTSCGGTTPSVVLYDAAKGTQKTLTTDGGAPALSPDGAKVAFVRTVDGHAQL
ncbi:TolB family protein [Streptomyces sp. NPDC054833]